MDFSPQQFHRLMDLQRQKKALLQEFYRLAQLQEELIERDDATALGGNLNQRQKLIEQVDALHQELDLLMQTYAPASRQRGEGDPQVAEHAAIQREIAKLLKQIAVLDECNQNRASAKIRHYREEIKRLSLSRKTLQSYGQGAIALGSELFDKKS